MKRTLTPEITTAVAGWLVTLAATSALFVVVLSSGCSPADSSELLGSDGDADADAKDQVFQTPGGGDAAATGGDCAVLDGGLLLQGDGNCVLTNPVAIPGNGGLRLIELAIGAAPQGALASALAAARTEILNGDFTQCEDVTGNSTAAGCRVQGQGTFTHGATAVTEGTAFGNGFKVEVGLDVDSLVRVQIDMTEAQRAAFVASKRETPDNPTFPEGTRWRIGFGKSLRNTARVTVKMGLEVLGAGGNVQLAGNLQVSTGSEYSNNFVLNQATALSTLLATEGVGSVRSVALQMINRGQPNLMATYAAHLGGNIVAIAAYVNSIASGNGAECAQESSDGNDETLEGARWHWSRTALCVEGQLCCRGGLVGLSLRRTSAYCYADTPAYRAQNDCSELGLSR
jgi:hypothetical protein